MVTPLRQLATPLHNFSLKHRDWDAPAAAAAPLGSFEDEKKNDKGVFTSKAPLQAPTKPFSYGKQVRLLSPPLPHSLARALFLPQTIQFHSEVLVIIFIFIFKKYLAGVLPFVGAASVAEPLIGPKMTWWLSECVNVGGIKLGLPGIIVVHPCKVFFFPPFLYSSICLDRRVSANVTA